MYRPTGSREREAARRNRTPYPDACQTGCVLPGQRTQWGGSCRFVVAAEIMGSVYRGLLRQMELDKFRVFEKEYRLNKLEKAGRIGAQLLKSW